MESPMSTAGSPGTRNKSVKKLLGRRKGDDIQLKSNKKSATPSNQVTDSISKSKVTSQTPTTVAEAQEVGENARINDDLTWALDGLESTNISSIEDSLADLIDLLSSRRGRFLLQGDSTVDILLSKLADIRVEEAPQITLAIACILLILTMRGKLSVFTKEVTTKLLRNIMSIVESVRLPAESTRLSKSIMDFLSDQHINRLLPKEVSLSPLCISLAFLSFSLSPREDYDATNIKMMLGKSECFDLVVDIAVLESSALNDPRPTMKTVQSLWKLKSLFSILEHACFACPDNVNHLSTLQVSSGCPPYLSEMKFTHWLISQIKLFCSQKLMPEGLKKDCFQGILAVLMNITEGNEKVAKSISGSDDLETLCNSFKYIVLQNNTSVPSIDTLKPWIDEVSTLLGILINIVEADDAAIASIKSMSLPRYHTQDSRESVLDIATLLFILSKDEKSGTESAGDGEVTLDSLRDGEGRAISSVVGAYSGILIGFLVVQDPLATSQALKLLEFDNLTPVIDNIRKCLAFYKNVGALTSKTETSLQRLISRLEQPLP